mmetsp:Transcript_71216/g.148935  ORF Transcript_71216/g.148935 Transcript_71216/m.148935 type:complete len:506 (+) Transcript_71216:67-1584(+)
MSAAPAAPKKRQHRTQAAPVDLGPLRPYAKKAFTQQKTLPQAKASKPLALQEEDVMSPRADPVMEGFKAIVMAVIVACCCSTALEVDHSNWRFQGTVKIHLFTFLNNVFVVFFTAEIAMRIFDVGLREFFTNTKFSFWNIFDLTIVLIGIANQFSVDYLAYQFNSTGDEYHPYGKGNYWTASLGRVFRTARVLRVLHIFRHIPKLRVLSEGLIAAVMTVFWMMVLAFFMIFSFSIVMTMLMKEHINAFPAEEQPQIRELWGSVGATMFTAFQFLTMDGWSGIYRDIVTRLPYLRLLLCPFIFFGGFVIMSCLTGVMADYMNEVRKIQEIRETRQRAADVRHIVEHLKMNDTDHDGLLDLKEFIKLFEDEGFVKGLRDAGVKVDRKDAYDLFPWFDADHNEKVEFKEIIAGVETLCSGTDVVAMVKLGKAIRDAAEFVDANSSEMAEEWRPTNRFERHHQRLERTAKHLANLENRTDELEAALRAFTNQFSFDLSLHTGEDPDSEQ